MQQTYLSLLRQHTVLVHVDELVVLRRTLLCLYHSLASTELVHAYKRSWLLQQQRLEQTPYTGPGRLQGGHRGYEGKQWRALCVPYGVLMLAKNNGDTR